MEQLHNIFFLRIFQTVVPARLWFHLRSSRIKSPCPAGTETPPSVISRSTARVSFIYHTKELSFTGPRRPLDAAPHRDVLPSGKRGCLHSRASASIRAFISSERPAPFRQPCVVCLRRPHQHLIALSRRRHVCTCAAEISSTYSRAQCGRHQPEVDLSAPLLINILTTSENFSLHDGEESLSDAPLDLHVFITQLAYNT